MAGEQDEPFLLNPAIPKTTKPTITSWISDPTANDQV